MVGSEPKCGEERECQNGKSGTNKERNPSVRKRVLVEPGGWLHKGGPLKKCVNVLRIVEVRFPTVRERSYTTEKEKTTKTSVYWIGIGGFGYCCKWEVLNIQIYI